MCQTEKALNEHYRALNDEELLKLAAEGGLTGAAEHVLDKELAQRKLTLEDAKQHFAPQWLDKADVGTVGLVVLEDGEQITAEVTGLNEQGDQLEVKVISPESVSLKGARHHRKIPFRNISSFQPQPHLMEQWPYSDPCRRKSSRPRILLMSAIFLCMTVGSLPLFLTLISRPYGLQQASIISYTLVVVFFTFATTGSGPGGKKCSRLQVHLSRRRAPGSPNALATPHLSHCAFRPPDRTANRPSTLTRLVECA